MSATASAGEPLLAGLTVLDFTRVLAGPYCTRLLADLGARVVKVERPGEGDEVRYTVMQLERDRADQSTYFVRLNAGKRGIAVDLAHPQGREVVLDLVRRADVVVENFSPGVMARYGLEAAALRGMRPELVYCSISGFGQTGPLSSMQAYAHLVNAMSGLMDLERGAEAQPRVSYLQAADVLAGAHAFGSICAALLRRARTGQGATLDVSMLECLVCADDITYTAVLNGAPVERRSRVGMLVHAVGDGHVAMQTAGAAHLLPRLAKLMGRPEIVTDPRFSTPMARRANWAAFLEIVRNWLDTFESVEQAVTALAEARVPHAPMLSPEQVVAHPHMAARSAFPEVDHPAGARVRVTAAPFHLDGAPIPPAGPAPYRIGEDTRAVLRDVLGYPEERVNELVRSGAVAAPA
jgi:crotonobetainyl-CoA:carnitine CoA-transferase CaiB-like acyl-CoA transferase